MTIGEVILLFNKELKGIYPDNEINSIIEYLFSHYTGLSRFQIFSERNKILSEDVKKYLSEVLPLLLNHKPVQYITGFTEFYNCRLQVTPDVLIPRPETEELVKWIIDDEQTSPLRILDIGTGSGNIAIALAKNITGSVVDACDISEPSLTVAGNNAVLNNAWVNLFHLDILKWQEEKTDITWDIIVSNPPYVCISEIKTMLPNVHMYEPHIALFVPDDNPLIFYKSVADFSGLHLAGGGSLYFEINENHAVETINLLNHHGFENVTLKTDINGKNRMLKANKK